MKTHSHSKIRILLVSLLLSGVAMCLIGCKNSIIGIYCKSYKYSNSRQSFQLDIYSDSLAVLTFFIQDDYDNYNDGNYYSSDYFKIHFLKKDSLKINALDVDINNIPYKVKRISKNASGVSLKFDGLFSSMDWSLIIPGGSIDITDGETINIPFQDGKYRLRGVFLCDSFFCRHDTVYTEEFDITDKSRYHINVDCRFWGLPYYIKSELDDVIIIHSPSIIELKRRNHILNKSHQRLLEMNPNCTE